MEIIIKAFELILTFDKDLYEIIFLSLKVSTIALVFSIILGLPISAFVATNNFVGKKIVKIFFNSLMALPPVFVGLIFTFIWNDYFWALVLVQSDSVRPVTVGIQVLRGQWVASWNLIAAGSIVCALPPVIMFFILQKQFIRGLTFGAVKG